MFQQVQLLLLKLLFKIKSLALFKLVSTNMQHTLIIADLHLTQVENDKIELFGQFCTEYASQVDQLFILGDLFNTWIGDDISLNTYQSIATILNKLTKTTQVFVMAGNRDFLLSNSFEKETGCKIIKEPHLLNHNEKNYLLIHGDSLCTDDVDYQKLKKVSETQLFNSSSFTYPKICGSN